MKALLIASVVLNAVQAVAADVAIAANEISFTGLGPKIPLRNVQEPSGSFKKTLYSAGVAKSMTYTFTSVEDGKAYTITLNKYPAVPNGIQQGNSLYNTPEKYTIVTPASGNTVTTLAVQFKNAINAAIAQGLSAFTTATNAAGVLTIPAATANFDFLIDMSASIGAQAVTVAFVPASGTYAQVVAINSNATSGLLYDQYEFVWYYNITDGVELMGVTKNTLVKVIVFINNADADKAALETEVDAIIAGTHTPVADYLGIN